MSADAPVPTPPPGFEDTALKPNDDGLNSADKGAEPLEGQVITEAYVRLSTIQWEWGYRLPKWQRNAVFSMVGPEVLMQPDHPLREPGSDGMRLYDVTDATGCTRISMSLRQLEYLQYYIHEMRLADPVWTEHLSTVPKDQIAEADKQVGPAEYPPGEEWVQLPDQFVYGNDIVKVEEICFDDAKELRRYQTRQRSANKRITTKKMMSDDREFEAAKARMLEAQAKAKAIEEEERRKAKEDNETEGPGLRRGPERHRRRPRRVPRGDAEDGDDEAEDGYKLGVSGGGFSAGKEEAAVDSAKTLAGMENLTLGEGTSDQSLSSTPNSSVPPSPLVAPVSNFTSNYYDHAQQALLIATLGGMYEAQKGQPEYLKEMADLTETAPIGRSLFISLRLVTWEADDSTVLEVGWSAIWWQEKLDSTGESKVEDRFEELRDTGHIKVADHLVNKTNGTWKPNNRNDYQFGDSLPIASRDLVRTVQEKIKDLSARAGGGPTYVILHSADGTHADPSKIGIATKEWYAQFKPPHWDYPCYACIDGIGKTFIIDTGILLAAVEYDPTAGPAPIKTGLTMEEAAWLVFSKDDIRKPHLCGNAGNDAFYNLELFIALVTAPSLETLREDFKAAKAAPKLTTDPVEVSSDDTVVADGDGADPKHADGSKDGHDEVLNEDDDDDYSEDERILGVYTHGPDGELIQLD